MQTVNDIAQTLNVRATVKPADSNPQMVCSMPPGSSHYRVEFRRREDGKTRRLSCYYSMGPAHASEPDPAKILACLADDAIFLDCASDFEDWARELSLDPENPETARAYRRLEDQRIRLANFMGDYFDALLSADQG